MRLLNSTLPDYMITIFHARRSGMDCRNPGSMDGFELAIHGTVSAISHLLLMPVLKFEAQPAIQGFIASARDVNHDLADLLIAHSAKFSNCQRIFTFDKKAATFQYFQLLTE